MKKKRVLSGIRANARLHLGNYLGAIKGMLALQENSSYETFYMVADLHSINVPYEPSKFQESVRHVILDYLSAGLESEKSTIFVQSHVPEHVELSYLFSSTLSVARMRHLPTYKEKVKTYPKDVNMALLYYPILMAADILIYKANEVPVGDDQICHLEVAREVARKMNDKYKLDFPEPKQFKTKGHYVPSLLGQGKMSKSVPGSFINLTDDLETIKKKIAKVPTDSGKGNLGKDGSYISTEAVSDGSRIKNIAGSGGVRTLLELVELFQGIERRKEYESQYNIESGGQGIRYGDLKNELAEAIYQELKPIQKRRKELEKDVEYIDRVIAEGAEKARKIAKETLREVKGKMGLS